MHENLNAPPSAQIASRINNYLVIVHTNRGPRICKAKLNFCCYIPLRGRHSDPLLAPRRAILRHSAAQPHYYNFDNLATLPTVKLNVCLKIPRAGFVLGTTSFDLSTRPPANSSIFKDNLRRNPVRERNCQWRNIFRSRESSNLP